MMRTIVTVLALSLVSCAISGPESAEAKIARAQSAAHSDLSKNAKIVDADGRILKQGGHQWVCMPGIPVIPGDKHPMCNDAEWRDLMKAAGAGDLSYVPKTIGISYMLMGDAHVSNSDPNATDPNNGDVWVQEGPHLMIVVPHDLLQGLTDDPYNGGPYVMWKDTPFAHIMVPIQNK